MGGHICERPVVREGQLHAPSPHSGAHTDIFEYRSRRTGQLQSVEIKGRAEDRAAASVEEVPGRHVPAVGAPFHDDLSFARCEGQNRDTTVLDAGAWRLDRIKHGRPTGQHLGPTMTLLGCGIWLRQLHGVAALRRDPVQARPWARCVDDVARLVPAGAPHVGNCRDRPREPAVDGDLLKLPCRREGQPTPVVREGGLFSLFGAGDARRIGAAERTQVETSRPRLENELADHRAIVRLRGWRRWPKGRYRGQLTMLNLVGGLRVARPRSRKLPGDRTANRKHERHRDRRRRYAPP